MASPSIENPHKTALQPDTSTADRHLKAVPDLDEPLTSAGADLEKLSPFRPTEETVVHVGAAASTLTSIADYHIPHQAYVGMTVNGITRAQPGRVPGRNIRTVSEAPSIGSSTYDKFDAPSNYWGTD